MGNAIMQNLRAHLLTLEGALQTSEIRSSESRLRELLAPDFREFGRSGGCHDLADILSSLANEAGPLATTIEDFTAVRLSETIVLVTYRGVRLVDREDRVLTNRSSIWRLDPDGNWRMVFHQGTPAA
jgi:hypothetical protein